MKTEAQAKFTGFKVDGYRFLTELEFNNEKSFVDANRQRYNDGIRDPMRALVQDISPLMLDIDPSLNTKLSTTVSRLNRDTRFSKNKLPYRTCCWFCFRRPGEGMSECFGLYFEVRTSGYSLGGGIYMPDPGLMAPMRSRILAKPTAFLAAVKRAEKAGFLLYGDMYKKDRFPNEKAELKPYLNRKSLGWTIESTDVKKTLTPAIEDELTEKFTAFKPLYRLLTGLE